ncbi:MAG TPA: LL-diaminopimelate aminotransferase [Chloroflexota bacterium]|nr:LL-diaminopimelate aminotransferase [Chloroflexota bacterium]
MTREFEVARRLAALPPYLFVEIDRKRREAIARGIDVINLSIGDPDLPTPLPIVRALARAARDPANHRYPESEGLERFRQAVSDWYRRRFGVELSPQREVLTLIGAKEGIGHLPLAVVNPGDIVLIPDPAYPVYRAGTIFAGGIPYEMPLRRENGFLPDLSAIPRSVLERARLMFLNYPNNPTGAVAPVAFYEEVVAFAQRHNIIVAQDNTYSEICFDGYRPPSFLQVPGAKDIGIEFHSLSKTFNMTGWRIACAVGRAEVIEALRMVKSNLDSGAFQAVQEAGIVALSMAEEISRRNSAIYQRRRDVLVRGLRKVGLEVDAPRATFYVWPRVPPGQDSAGFVARLIETAGIVATPGSGFGKEGEGYVRFALTAPIPRLREAIGRLQSALG